MLEIIVVLMTIGLLSAVAISKIDSPQSYSALAEADILKMHLRYAQIRALGDNVSWSISFSGNTYTLQQGGSTPYNLPNENSPTHQAQRDDTTFSGGPVAYDEWGSPGTQDINIAISQGGETVRTVTVTKNTGFIP